MSRHENRPRVLVTPIIHEEAMNRLKEVAEVTSGIPRKITNTKTELLKMVEDYEGVIIGASEPFDRDVITAGKKLKVISRFGVGYDNVDVKTAVERAIYVTNTPVNYETVADLTIGLILAAARQIPQAYMYMKNKKWGIESRVFDGTDIFGKTLGIVGLGRIGSAVARRAKGFNMTIMYYDVVRNKYLEESLGINHVPFEILLTQADIVTVHTPLTEKTKGLIGEKELKKMKRSAIFVNTSRGPVIDEAALYKALKEGWIASAGIDVFAKEPLNLDSPLLTLENIVHTPHVAGSTEECRYRQSIASVENTVRVLKGEKPLYYVTS